jgi:chemotaxis signal transduction protein
MTAIDADARRILEERARLLAQPIVDDSAAGDGIDVLVFSRAGTRYAVDANMVAEVVPLAEPTPLVSLTAAIVGVVNHRGRVIAIVDIASLLTREPAQAAETEFAVVVQAGGAWLALRADAVSGITRVDERDVRPAAELGDRSDTVVRALTADMTAILDVETLSRDPRVEVDDEVE